MDNVVSARRLRKSLLKNLDSSYIDNLNLNNYRNVNIDSEEKKETKKRIKFKSKVFIKISISLIIIFTCLCTKLLFYENIKEKRVLGILKREYNKNYEKEYILLKTEKFFKNNEKKISYVIPNLMISYIKNTYHTKLKPKYLEFNIKNVYYNIINNSNSQNTITVSVFNNKSEIENIDEENNKEIIQNSKVVNPSSALNSMELDIDEIKKKKISIIQPVSGTITSLYGAREEILDGVGTFHTGIDIANVLNTEIKSATDGVVTKVEENNKYYGNNIEITLNDVTFKYAHLNKIEVELNSKVKQGDIIGKMGSTGYSTGSHLHFEILYNSRTVDPQKLVDIR